MLNKKKVLGRGIGALIGGVQLLEGVQRPESNQLQPQKADGRYFACPILDISPNKTQPRKRFSEESLKELSNSIKENGVIEPLLVRRTPNGYELIAGERRWRASKMAALTEVPVVVIDATDEESLELAVIENIQREDLDAIEEAEAYKSLMGFGLSQDEVAKRVGKERSTVANYLRLLKLPLEVRDELVKGSITMGHARALLSIEGHSAQVEYCRQIITKGLSVRETEALVSKSGPAFTYAGKVKNKKAHAPNPVEDDLRAVFGTKVLLKDKKGKGSIEIMYYSADERERIIELLKSIGGKAQDF